MQSFIVCGGPLIVFFFSVSCSFCFDMRRRKYRTTVVGLAAAKIRSSRWKYFRWLFLREKDMSKRFQPCQASVAPSAAAAVLRLVSLNLVNLSIYGSILGTQYWGSGVERAAERPRNTYPLYRPQVANVNLR